MTAGPERTALEDELSLAKEPPRRSATRLLLRHPLGAPCLVFVLLVVLVAIFAPWLARWGPQETDLAATNAPPLTPGHLLGGDSAGLDILSRLIWGSRQTVVAIVIVVVVSVAIGVTTGLVSGFYRGRLDAGAGFLSDVIMSLPGIVLLIALYALTGPNIPIAMAVLGVRNELYVDAARVVGLSDLRIVARHVLWAVRAPVIIQTSFVMAAGIGIEAGISFLGLGDPASASWGIVLQNSFNGIYNNPWG